MFKKFSIMTIAPIIMVLLFNMAFTPQRSSYIFLFGDVGILDCNGPYQCRHEIGHKMDQSLGFPSESVEFGIALQAYMLVEMRTGDHSELSEFLITYPGIFSPNPTLSSASSTQKETYAGIYAWADGDMSLIPLVIRPFYSTDQKYQDLYLCLLQRNKLNVCDGTSFSYLK